MKKILFVMAAAIVLMGCEKRSCYTCVEKYRKASLYSNEPFVEVGSSSHCGWTAEDAASYAQSQSRTGQSTYGYPSIVLVSCYPSGK